MTVIKKYNNKIKTAKNKGTQRHIVIGVILN